MIKRITLYILFLCTWGVTLAQGSLPDDQYNSFSSRSFMKFNSFLTVPTFSVLYKENQTVEAFTRSSNIQFEDASRLHVFSYAGKMKDNVGAGFSVFQQEVGVFKDFGAIANYAYQIQLNQDMKLAFGFNFFYSRRSINNQNILSQVPDQVPSNFQDIPIVNFQPAVTLSYENIDVGLFFENLADFNLKKSEFVTGFADKTISAHAGYTMNFDNSRGLLENTKLRAFAVARRSKADGFSFAGNLLADLPKAGWIKVGYDNLYGLNAGFGVNLSTRLSIGFAYEKQDNLGGTNEVGLIYNLGKPRRSFRRSSSGANKPIRTPKIEIELPQDNTPIVSPTIKPTPKTVEQIDYDDPEHNDLSDEIQRAQDSIDALNKKVDQILKLLKERPNQVITQQVVQPTETLDTSLKRSTAKPWRRKTVTRRSTGGGSGGTMYYVVADQFSTSAKAKALIQTLKRRKIKAAYVRDPKTKQYYVYIDRFSKRETADERVEELSDDKRGFEDDGDKEGDLGVDVDDKKTKMIVYTVKITLAAEGETYTEPKTQPRARVRTMNMMPGLEPGYYLVVNVYSKKPYADKFIDELRSDGINANFFLNPTTGNRHVYILKTADRAEAIKLYNNNLNGKYYDRKNIIHIK